MLLLLLLGAELGYLNHMYQCAEEEQGTIAVVNWRVSCLHKQGITNTLALPIDKMLYIYYLHCLHTLHTKKNPFQFKQSKHFHQRNWFTQFETGSNKLKLPKVGSNAIVPAPTGAGPNKGEQGW